MPKAPKAGIGESKKAIHPNSRKALQLSRKAHHEERVQRRQDVQSMKLELLGNKLQWFQDNLDLTKTAYTKADLAELVERYLGRFDEELQQIEIVNSMKSRQGRQHVPRETAIKTTLEKEKRDYETVGLEVPDVMNGKNLRYFRDWTGELRYIQNIKLRRAYEKDCVKNKVEQERNVPMDNEQNGS